MERVFSIDDIPWADLKGLSGARGFEFKALTNDAYTKAYSCELVRLDPGDHSVPHIEPWSHLLYALLGKRLTLFAQPGARYADLFFAPTIGL
jgi:hypothetical protein